MFPTITIQLVRAISYFDVCIGFCLSRTVFFVRVLDKIDTREVFFTREVTHEKSTKTTSIMLGKRYVIGFEQVTVRHEQANNKVKGS